MRSRFVALLGTLWLFLGQMVIGQTLPLPFFDDFSTSAQTASPTRWAPGSGVYINNTLTVNHPTVNVATFDGLRADGFPYALNNENAEGGTDTLMSLPVNMAGLSARDSVYISFYWQRKGLGEAPDENDSLSLAFKTAGGTWLTLWAKSLPVHPLEPQKANNPAYKADSAAYGRKLQVYKLDSTAYYNPNFNQSFVRVDDPALFHANAQFRFVSRGRQSGAFDEWHIDYVYLNKGRSAFDKYIRDIAVRQPVTPLLRRYTAMPMRQFQAKATAELADSVATDINNLFNDFNFTTFRYLLRDETSGRELQNVLSPTATLVQALGRQNKAGRPTVPAGLGAKAVLRSTFNVTTTDNQNNSLPGVDLRQNDTISGVTVLDNYYAYDDGSAEVVKQINQRLARVAVRFVNNLPDAVTGIRINIVPTRRDQTGQQVVFGIYNDTGNGVPAPRPVAQKSFSLTYAAARNGFVDYRFDYPVDVRDTFYVAFSQLDDPPIPVGFDRNSPFRNQIYINLGNSWDVSPDRDGALMIRPLMNNGPSAVITATEPVLPLSVFPNPTNSTVNWPATTATQLDVLDVVGRPVLSMPLTTGQTRADLGQLPDGFYLLRFTDPQGPPRTSKLLIRH
ncbi:T9SS type A sorting domain-containing protein [Fibrella sp. HMF5335]|uniref:T9SS type A sorting domain-containing protein n=1 Tax=Fibrella rubiginis TaxID=2817060 RepID=A0A939GER7_9BACT|nr:T9SS type A sorting domain-containing protein [Fibrella rubiginis]MBO0935207.1 T9SS type A sorting domain-containing protein [Fibrella rubiginis]